MPVQQIQCPNCRQPVQAEVEQLFDVTADPAAKQILLSGAVNRINCPFCGYQGDLGTPLVYHDAEKELLLTFVPAELGLPRDEQEKVIGRLITRVMDRLPQEMRKAYLLNPETTLTQQRLIERVLEADGITPEMIEAQQKRLNLVQRLLGAAEDVRAEIIKQEEQLLDGEFFTLLSRLIEASLMGGDRESAQQLSTLQEQLLPETEFGRQYKQQADEIDAAVKSLQELGDGLTREKLLDLIINAPNETRMGALVSLTRPALDYPFFQMLSDRLEASQGEERARLTDLRVRLLELTREIDQQMEARMVQAGQLLDSLLEAPDIKEAVLENLPAIDDFFIQALNNNLEAATKGGDLERSAKLREVVTTLQEASAPPPELAFIQELIDAPDDQARQQLMDERPEAFTEDLLGNLAALLNQAQASGDQDLSERLQAIHQMAVRQSMRAKLRGA